MKLSAKEETLKLDINVLKIDSSESRKLLTLKKKTLKQSRNWQRWS